MTSAPADTDYIVRPNESVATVCHWPSTDFAADIVVSASSRTTVSEICVCLDGSHSPVIVPRCMPLINWQVNSVTDRLMAGRLLSPCTADLTRSN